MSLISIDSESHSGISFPFVRFNHTYEIWTRNR
jgi:hypothetical protein